MVDCLRLKLKTSREKFRQLLGLQALCPPEALVIDLKCVFICFALQCSMALEKCKSSRAPLEFFARLASHFPSEGGWMEQGLGWEDSAVSALGCWF